MLFRSLERIGFNEDMARRERFTSFENMLQGMQEAAALQQARENDKRKSMIIGAAAQAAKAGISYGADKGWFSSDDVVRNPDTVSGPLPKEYADLRD